MTTMLTIATLATPLTRALASSARRSSVTCSGSSREPLLHLVGDLVVTEVAADQRQILQLIERGGELVGELAGLDHGPRSEHADQQGGQPEHAQTHDGDGDAATEAEPALDGIGDGIEGQGDHHADGDAGDHRGRAPEQGDEGEGAEDRHHEVDEGPPVEVDATAGAGQLLRLDPQRGTLFLHVQMMACGDPPAVGPDQVRIDADYGWCVPRSDHDATSAPPTRVWKIGLTPGSAALLVGAVLTAFVLRNAFVQAHRTVGWVIACGIVALLIDPLVDFVDRLLPRILSVIVVLLAMLAVVGGVTIGLANDAIKSLEDLKASAPEAAQELEARYTWAEEVGVADRVTAFVDDLDKRVREGRRVPGSPDGADVRRDGRAHAVPPGVRPALLRRVREPVPRGRVGRLNSVVGVAAIRGRRYLLATLAHATVNGLVIGWLCWMLDLPAARSLGIAVGRSRSCP